MSNTLIPLSQAVADTKAWLDALSPAEQRAAVYAMQTDIGGFPRDLALEAEIAAALKAE